MCVTVYVHHSHHPVSRTSSIIQAFHKGDTYVMCIREINMLGMDNQGDYVCILVTVYMYHSYHCITHTPLIKPFHKEDMLGMSSLGGCVYV